MDEKKIKNYLERKVEYIKKLLEIHERIISASEPSEFVEILKSASQEYGFVLECPESSDGVKLVLKQEDIESSPLNTANDNLKIIHPCLEVVLKEVNNNLVMSTNRDYLEDLLEGILEQISYRTV